jgi:hypothetical protein
MTWRGPRGRADRQLTNAKWKWLRSYWLQQRPPCWRCGREIAYNEPYYVIADGKKTVNPNAFVLGHVIGRAEGRSLGYTDEQLETIENTAPEHALCSQVSGSRAGQRRQRQLLLQRREQQRRQKKAKPEPQPKWKLESRW